MEQRKMDLAFANELWNTFLEKANQIGLLNLAYSLERDEPPFNSGDGPRHPDAWLRYLLFRNKVEELEIPLIEAILYNDLDCTIDADINDISFLVFPAPIMPDLESEEEDDDSSDAIYEELPHSEKMAFLTLYDEEGEDQKLIRALEKGFGTYLVVMNAADKAHFDEFKEVVKQYNKKSNVLLLGRNLTVTELDWFKEEFTN
jgi:hypothetical protein